ncbi:hypothetical protein ETAA8_57360 [Anatilimnocola aggregata]|uniref:Uncharacterized protein n=1 Tax=Anatilimnocola aggregata TaxID=2528021 RepID=A0A517YK42_9BACT|nr:hypothetical protein ETAA8_57360 [Anatilimnocola aggregata]
MRSGSSHHDGPLGHFLATDIGKVIIVAAQFVEQFSHARWDRSDIDDAT